MVSDELYEKCLPVLQDTSLEDDDKTEKLEELLRKEFNLNGKPLENAVLDSLWRFHSGNTSSTSPPPSRHTIIRKSSPAPWQINRTPTPSASSSPRTTAPPPGFGIAPPAFTRAKSVTASPFTSPRPSPRPTYSTPHIPHSPSLNAYEFSEPAATREVYGDYGSDTVDWLVNDETASNASSSYFGEAGLNGAAPEWVQPTTMDMSPYDMLRSILRDSASDEDIEKVLGANNFDLSATIMALMESNTQEPKPAPSNNHPEPDRNVLIGKSMSPSFRPATPVGQMRSTVMCKYWLSTGHCARADCRFSHDPSKTVCKYWMMGNCLAGSTCVFSHDPSNLIARLMVDETSASPPQMAQPNFQLHDHDTFPALQGGVALNLAQGSYDPATLEQIYGAGGLAAHSPGMNPFRPFSPHRSGRPQSRPTSRSQNHSRAGTPSLPSVDDAEAFPSLGSASTRGGKKHHGKRGGHGHHNHKENSGPSSLADLVRMSPSPSPAQNRKNIKSPRNGLASKENSEAARNIPEPVHVPWLETGDGANKAYLKARQEAFKHGGLRNKFLQSAAQAWNRNDTRAAKALSLRGQSENNLMREAHREAARLLYEERNKDNGVNGGELYVDLHGLHPEEAVQYLSGLLTTHQSSERTLYAITGTGHHSKNGKDKVGKAVRGFLNEWRYVFREFSVPGDRANIGGILGINPASWDRSLAGTLGVDGAAGEGESSKEVKGESTKIRILKAEDVVAPTAGSQKGIAV